VPEVPFNAPFNGHDLFPVVPLVKGEKHFWNLRHVWQKPMGFFFCVPHSFPQNNPMVFPWFSPWFPPFFTKQAVFFGAQLNPG
jgi:hypothetical protein